MFLCLILRITTPPSYFWIDTGKTWQSNFIDQWMYIKDWCDKVYIDDFSNQSSENSSENIFLPLYIYSNLILQKSLIFTGGFVTI